ncbi:tyrosine-type recombinase/integrase [Sulfitobacter donghicola]|uniref:Integrase n=1 Tax=Sulfitobacter donghicola DSW-25 = KCTC 12864 = JCM 14565 TaxID=1300350 RepID=A0A073IJV0_9RHOB|nr:site-specific integrase [Sulfitobacter donghicola]KEJ89811.1 integrase [Sulfitobacter donghicola DSW-25 = KCTC 12864 = JCM 14565]KIN67074.1 Integrase [Sulfitobacter donghicola DSW-25 = KCTC 12864 = JCM 14565]
MAAIHKLSARQIETLPSGKHGDGGGLWLNVRDGGSRQWVLRVTVHGRRREMGLGGYPALSLKKAREVATHWRTMAKAGVDPVKAREKERRDALRNLHQFADVARDAFEARKAELKDEGNAGRWMSPLERHIIPKIGKVPVSEIDQIDIRDALKPIWHEKADTARKAMNRIGIVLKHAAALGLDVDLQACEKAKALLGKTRHVAKHVPAMPWQEVPAFYEDLSDGTVTHLALRLLILTGVRSQPLRLLTLDQLDGDTWTIPAENMKGAKGKTSDFRVPLSTEAQRVIEQALPHSRNNLLFSGSRGRSPISDMTLSQYMARASLEARPHGFRTSLRTWIAECTDAPHEIAEMTLAHATGNSVSRAYQRSDLLEQRRALLERWASHVTGLSGQLVKLHG